MAALGDRISTMLPRAFNHMPHRELCDTILAGIGSDAMASRTMLVIVSNGPLGALVDLRVGTLERHGKKCEPGNVIFLHL